MPPDVSNIYTYVVSVTNPSNKVILQLQAANYKPLSILQMRISQRKLDVDEYITWALSRVSAPYTLPNTPSFNADVMPYSNKEGNAIDPGFRTATSTSHGAHTSAGTIASTPFIDTFHVKVGGLWLPPIDPVTGERKPFIIEYGEIYVVRFPVAPGNRDIDLLVELQEG